MASSSGGGSVLTDKAPGGLTWKQLSDQARARLGLEPIDSIADVFNQPGAPAASTPASSTPRPAAISTTPASSSSQTGGAESTSRSQASSSSQASGSASSSSQAGSSGGGAAAASSHPDRPYTRAELEAMGVKQLKALVAQRGLSGEGCIEKDDFVDMLETDQLRARVAAAAAPPPPSTKPEPKEELTEEEIRNMPPGHWWLRMSREERGQWQINDEERELVDAWLLRFSRTSAYPDEAAAGLEATIRSPPDADETELAIKRCAAGLVHVGWPIVPKLDPLPPDATKKQIYQREAEEFNDLWEGRYAEMMATRVTEALAAHRRRMKEPAEKRYNLGWSVPHKDLKTAAAEKAEEEAAWRAAGQEPPAG